MKPIRVQRKRTKGYRMPANTKYVGRPSRFGNPHNFYEILNECMPEGYISKHTARQLAVDKYRYDIERGFIDGVSVDTVRRELRGKNLACYCPLDEPCHADVLLEIANS